MSDGIGGRLVTPGGSKREIDQAEFHEEHPFGAHAERLRRARRDFDAELWLEPSPHRTVPAELANALQRRPLARWQNAAIGISLGAAVGFAIGAAAHVAERTLLAWMAP